MQIDQNDSIAILMAVYNGADHLDAQLASFAAQSHQKWQLLASDDGSSDDSIAKLGRFRAEGHQVSQIQGQGQGAAMNFIHMLREAPKHIAPNGWLAFSDQDDVWLPDRLARGHAALLAGEPSQEQPALYCSRTLITDEHMQSRRLSIARPRAPSFRNALTQNIVGGNTILFNPAATRLVLAAAHEVQDVVVHDWWAYLLVTGAGGRVVHDDTPTVLYRQHDKNEIGANDRFMARMRRISMVLSGNYRTLNDCNITAMRGSSHRLREAEREVLEEFAAMRQMRLFKRLRSLHRLKLYRQTRISTAALWVAAGLGRF